MLPSLALVAAATIASPFLGRYVGRNSGWILAVPLAAAAGLLVAAAGDGVVETSIDWLPTLGAALSLRLDGLALLFGLLVLGIGAVVLAYSARYLKPRRHGDFFGLMTLFALAMLVLVLSDDVVVLFVAWEATTLCSFFLIGRSATGTREPAVRTLLVTAFGGLALLSAAVVMAVGTGTTRLSEILADDIWATDSTFTTVVAVLLAIAAFTKSAQFPFQSWLPDSMVAITPVSTYLHAAAMVKAGIYLLFRFSPVLGEVPVWQGMLVGAGLITAALGAVGALRRHDLKELLAYSTVSQLGFLVAMIGVGTPDAIEAALVHTLAHALFKSALFMLVGVIDVQAGTRDIRRLGGLRRRMPVTATLTVLAASSMAGIPPLLGFLSKEGLLEAFWDAPGAPWVGPAFAVTIAVLAVMTFGYSARIVLGAFGGPARDDAGAVVPREAPATFWGPVALPALAGVVLGLTPFVLDGLFADAATAAAGVEMDTHLALWHGVNPALVLSVIILVLGIVLVLARARVDRVLQPLDSPISGLAVVDALRGGLIAGGKRIGHLTQTFDPRRHLVMPVVVLVAIAAVVAASGLDLDPRIPGDSTALDWGLLAFVSVGVVCVIVARTRMAAVVTIGVVGFAVTSWFFALGAADVALTQLLVEILTLVVMVLLLRRLPWSFRQRRRGNRIAPGLLAVGAGVATTAAVLAFTGRREMSAAGEYYVTQGPAETGGANVVNTILVDFRALDTLGELTVLGMAGIAIMVLLRSRRALEPREPEPVIDTELPISEPRSNTVFIQTIARFVGPLTVVLSVFALLRGHQEPGGGFIAALIGGAGLALAYLAAPSDEEARLKVPHVVMIAAGIAIAAGAGFLGYAEGSFLAPIHWGYVGPVGITSALVFDIGVYLAVIGVVLVALNYLGSHLLGLPPERIVQDKRMRGRNREEAPRS
ncbi:DUF4040 family protein [Demequina pelophila]|uniref:DUF4040 family protein n=1 Tax=Demequina pelophila TaxID=1638984 RepID=UPI0009E24EB9|nr:DUF4040 family protein [Demequina pelophila]